MFIYEYNFRYIHILCVDIMSGGSLDALGACHHLFLTYGPYLLTLLDRLIADLQYGGSLLWVCSLL